MDPTTFRWDPDQSVLWAGVRSYPARFYRYSMIEQMPGDFRLAHPDFPRMETRQAIVWFENQWCLSTVWGDASYSSNNFHRTAHPSVAWEFIEEPTQVEVGILVPDDLAIVHGAVEYDLRSGVVEMPERTTTLWGDPLCYVDVPMFHRVADLVMNLPTDCELPEGEWDTAEGFCDLLIAAGLEKTL